MNSSNGESPSCAHRMPRAFTAALGIPLASCTVLLITFAAPPSRAVSAPCRISASAQFGQSGNTPMNSCNTG